MQAREWKWIDKVSWGRGCWQDEPDKVQWPDSTTGLPCIARRNEHMGNWCGYVGVPPGHPCYGKNYSEVDVRVHGGLTYASGCQKENKDHGICHVPGHGEPDDIWWLGFDCGHCNDLMPVWKMFPWSAYRTLEYVKAECARLAEQLACE